MLNLFVSPRKAIIEAKQHRSFAYVFLLLVLASVAMFIGTIVFLESLAVEVLLLALLTMAGTFIGTVTLSFLMKISMGILTGIKGYYEALTMFALPVFVASTGFLIASLLGMIPYAGVVLMPVVMALVVTLSYTLSVKLGMELYNTDVLTVLMGTGIVAVGIVLGVYAGIGKGLAPALIEAALGSGV